eukprot:1745075-Lingulodinium_polyedra.AAC.1
MRCSTRGGDPVQVHWLPCHAHGTGNQPRAASIRGCTFSATVASHVWVGALSPAACPAANRK